MGRFRDLKVWQKAMDLVVEIYRGSEKFPVIERYGLQAQLRRAGVSVPCNIAEGHGRRGSKEYRHYLSIALGSLAELETQILIAERLQYLSSDEVALHLEKPKRSDEC